jgi:hypothetical protein
MKEAEIEMLYQEFWDFVTAKLVKHSPEAIAAVLSAQSMSIYKTIMDAEDFEKITTAIYESRSNVKSFVDMTGQTLQ